jgi:Na+/H+-dicarboxylate symporter
MKGEGDLSARNWLTVLTLAGLVLGAVVGQWMHVQLASAPDAEAVLGRYDGLAMDKQESMPAAWTAEREAALEAARGEAKPLLRVRAFRKIADFLGADIFMGLLRMLIVPLIVASVLVGVTSAGNVARLGRLAVGTFVYFFGTMLIAVALGMVVVSAVQPGIGFFAGDSGAVERESFLAAGEARRGEIAEKQKQGGIATPTSTGEALLGIFTRMIPTNPVRDLVEMNTLSIIFFTIFFGIVVSTLGARGEPIVALARAVMDAMIRMTEIVLWLAPVGVFCLVARAITGIGLEQFAARIGLYMATVIGALLVHGAIVLPLLLLLLARVNPLRYLLAMKEALLLAFSTASSSATLPVTIDCARTKGGCGRKASGFVLPLGATINMDGTALYEAVAVIFLAQAFTGGSLPWGDKVVLALTATLAAVGAAGIPEAGLTTMLIVITAVNSGGVVSIPPAAIGLILGVDRILDMTRTTVNVWGDAIGARIMTKYEPDGGGG